MQTVYAGPRSTAEEHTGGAALPTLQSTPTCTSGPSAHSKGARTPAAASARLATVARSASSCASSCCHAFCALRPPACEAASACCLTCAAAASRRCRASDTTPWRSAAPGMAGGASADSPAAGSSGLALRAASACCSCTRDRSRCLQGGGLRRSRSADCRFKRSHRRSQGASCPSGVPFAAPLCRQPGSVARAQARLPPTCWGGTPPGSRTPRCAGCS